MLDPKSDISVVITCYSEGKLLLDAISSLEKQTLSPAQIIVVNDASPDAITNQTCHTLTKNSDISVIFCAVNGGTSIARNRGFAEAKYKIIVPLDADDILPKNALEVIHKAFRLNPDAGFIYGNHVRQDKANTLGKVINPGDISLEFMLGAKPFSLSSRWSLVGTTPLRKSLWESVGGYDPNFGVEDIHDVEFWIRVIASGCKYYYIPQTIYIWRKYLGSNTRRVNPLAWYRISQQHIDIYRQIGLEYRAYELLLLGSKWLNHRKKINQYSQKLISCIKRSQFQFSTLIALGIPTPLFQVLARYAQKSR